MLALLNNSEDVQALKPDPAALLRAQTQIKEGFKAWILHPMIPFDVAERIGTCM